MKNSPGNEQSRSTRPRNGARCPACRAPIVWQKKEKRIVPCQPQRRLVVFPAETGNELSLVEERTGRVVTGRTATEEEARAYRDSGSPGKPFTIGREEHLPYCNDPESWEKEWVKAPSVIFAE